MKKIIKNLTNFIRFLNYLLGLVLLFFVYFIGVGITSITAKIFGKNFLEKESKDNYWSNINLKEKPIDEYYRQF